MKKLVDFDGLFDEKLSVYMEENAGKYTEKQWETLIPKLYKKFGDTVIKSVNSTPNAYYADMSDDELVETLRRHVEEDVPVSDFLCRELEKRRPEGLISLLDTKNEQLLSFAVNLTGNMTNAFPAYFKLIASEIDSEIKDLIVDQLKAGADEAKSNALELYEKGESRESMLEILSRCKLRDERVFNVLMQAFRETADELPMHASYLAAYGDERALPVLLDRIDGEDINYLEYQELKYAIESLGGSYTRPRDFSDDPYFIEIAEQSQYVPDFSEKKKTDA